MNSKTDAGDRLVPIHPVIEPILRERAASAQDGRFLFHVSGKTKYEERGMALIKLFGRLKTAAGYGETLVFHSIRKTVAGLFERAGCPENIAADVLGHEKPTMTYGLYSPGSDLKQRREWLLKAVKGYEDEARQATAQE